MRALARTIRGLFGASSQQGAAGDRLSAWQRQPRADLALPHGHARYVVVDVETTGLDLRRDSPIAIGAVGVRAGVIAHGDAFRVILRQSVASADANILIHGIGGEAQLAGREPASALLEFLEYAGSSPLVAFRSDFDQTVLARATREHLRARVDRPFIDLAFLLPALFQGTENGSLEDWIEHFGVGVSARHDALADAYATAQLLLIALSAAEAAGMGNARALLAMQKAQRWLGRRS
jgi:DNA polymerase-3 subunit epsilon